MAHISALWHSQAAHSLSEALVHLGECRVSIHLEILPVDISLLQVRFSLVSISFASQFPPELFSTVPRAEVEGYRQQPFLRLPPLLLLH